MGSVGNDIPNPFPKSWKFTDNGAIAPARSSVFSVYKNAANSVIAPNGIANTQYCCSTNEKDIPIPNEIRIIQRIVFFVLFKSLGINDT